MPVAVVAHGTTRGALTALGASQGSRGGGTAGGCWVLCFRGHSLGKLRHQQLQQPLVREVQLDTAMALPAPQESGEEEEEEDLRTRFSSSTAWYVIFAVARSPL